MVFIGLYEGCLDAIDGGLEFGGDKIIAVCDEGIGIEIVSGVIDGEEDGILFFGCVGRQGDFEHAKFIGVGEVLVVVDLHYGFHQPFTGGGLDYATAKKVVLGGCVGR